MPRIAYGFGTPKAETTVPTAVADGADVEVWFDEYGRQVDKTDNLAIAAKDVNDVAPALTQTFYHVWTQLTAIGSTSAQNVEDYHHHSIQVVVAALAGGENCVVRVEGSLDNTNWFNLDAADTTYTANGTYLLEYDNLKIKWIRFTFVTDSATAAVTLDADLFCGN